MKNKKEIFLITLIALFSSCIDKKLENLAVENARFLFKNIHNDTIHSVVFNPYFKKDTSSLKAIVHDAQKCPVNFLDKKLYVSKLYNSEKVKGRYRDIIFVKTKEKYGKSCRIYLSAEYVVLKDTLFLLDINVTEHTHSESKGIW